ncbi:MAG: hypothetical protein KDE34_23915, partial [Anaerolineales bacterium]|nr:hypothetical protein [Anaerolineales bacterium]
MFTTRQLILLLLVCGFLAGCTVESPAFATVESAGAEHIPLATERPTATATAPSPAATPVPPQSPVPTLADITDTPTATSAPTASSVPSSEICQQVTEIPRTECEALAAIYLHNSASWRLTFAREEPWLLSDKPCNWSGVRCTDGHITLLLLTGSGGENDSLPPQIGNLPHLEELAIVYFNWRTLPPEIGNLTQLKQ